MDNRYLQPAMAEGPQTSSALRVANPTFRENIEAKIQWHKDEIARLETIKEKMPFMLDINLRDLREAMNF